MVNNMKLTSKMIALLAALMVSVPAMAGFEMPFFDDDDDEDDFYRWYYYNSQRQAADGADAGPRRARPMPRSC